MGLKVFADFHHGDLYRALHYLFEKRLGHELYRMIGEEWYKAGYFRLAEPYNNNPGTIKQFLGLYEESYDMFQNLNGNWKEKNGIYYIYDSDLEVHHKAITLEKFREMHFDLVLSTHPLHDDCFEKLANSQSPPAKHAVLLGNIGQLSEKKNVISTNNLHPGNAVNFVLIHQEFDLETFYPAPVTNRDKISSFVINLPKPELWQEYTRLLPEYTWRAYGGSHNGWIQGLRNIAAEMRESTFGWHVKPAGDGFGHLLHDWAACGRPVITFFSDYTQYLGGKLLEDGVTGIDLGADSTQVTVEKIRYWSIPENHDRMCENVRRRFSEVVNYKRDAENVKAFLENLR